MTDPARERLLTPPRETEFVFTTLRGTYYRSSSRSHHWNRVRCGAGLGHVDLYTATARRFAGDRSYRAHLRVSPPVRMTALLRADRRGVVVRDGTEPG